ncbi:DoxX family protein [Gordonia zhaorongruii]|uniref:DoxX family protein n=1 Tax=Gordonia zhaorongruii TaxID=2597659 RepID=UPI00104D211D|nr:DoxX family protein [Gordonia zhaorongruii]
MSLLGFAGRALTGIPFVVLGYDAATSPGMRVDIAAPLLDDVRSVVPIPTDNDTVVRANGAVQAAGGALIAVGIAPRIAAGAVLASLVPTTLAGHAFWNHEDEGMRKQQQVQFIKNAALAGGLVSIIAAGRK